MTTKIKKIPIFKNVAEEAGFWDTHDVTEYISEMKAVDVEFTPRLSKEETIVIRVQSGLKARLEKIAISQGLGLSTLIRMWFIEKVRHAK